LIPNLEAIITTILMEEVLKVQEQKKTEIIKTNVTVIVLVVKETVEFVPKWTNKNLTL